MFPPLLRTWNTNQRIGSITVGTPSSLARTKRKASLELPNVKTTRASKYQRRGRGDHRHRRRGAHLGHAELHVPEQLEGRPGRRAQRHLQFRRDALRDGHRPACVPSRFGRRRHRRDPPRAAGVDDRHAGARGGRARPLPEQDHVGALPERERIEGRAGSGRAGDRACAGETGRGRPAVRQPHRGGWRLLRRGAHRGDHQRAHQDPRACWSPRGPRRLRHRGAAAISPRLARRLGVAHVVEGSVRRAGDPHPTSRRSSSR